MDPYSPNREVFTYPPELFDDKSNAVVYNLSPMIEYYRDKGVWTDEVIEHSIHTSETIGSLISLTGDIKLFMALGSTFSTRKEIELNIVEIKGVALRGLTTIILSSEVYSDLVVDQPFLISTNTEGDKIFIMTIIGKTGLPVILVYELNASDLLNCKPVIPFATVFIQNLERCKVITATWKDGEYLMLVAQTIGEEKDQEKRVRLVKVKLDEKIMEANTTFSAVQSTKNFPKSDNYSADICFFGDKIVIRTLTDRAVVYKIFEKDMTKNYPATIINSKDDYRLFSLWHNLISNDADSFFNIILNTRPSSIDPTKLELYIEATEGKMIDNDGSYEIVIESPAEAVLSVNGQTIIDCKSLELLDFRLDRSDEMIESMVVLDLNLLNAEYLNEANRISLFTLKRRNKLKWKEGSTDIKVHTDHFIFRS